ncbi:MAG: hypothetical protein ABSE85_02895 [Candidatus Korobacteraceae bacterium]
MLGNLAIIPAHLVLPKWGREEQPCFPAEDMQRIIAAAPAPYDTVFWLVATTGTTPLATVGEVTT